MKHLVIGTIFLILGLSLFTPIDEMLIIIPLSAIFGAWVLPLATGILLVCLGIGVYLVGRSKYIPNPIAHHIWIFVSVGVAICAYFTFQMM